MTENEVREKVSYWINFFNAKYLFLNQPQPNVAFFSKGTRAGVAWPKSNRLEFNRILMRQDNFESTIVHEVVHLILKKLFPRAKQDHGPEFKYLMNQAGFEGNRCHKYDVTDTIPLRKTTRYEYRCSCMSHIVTSIKHKKIQDGTVNYGCSICKDPLQGKFTGKVV